VTSLIDYASSSEAHQNGNIGASEREARRRLPKPTPLPGRPVRGSASGRPIMALLDLLGRRWALRILWELRTGEPTFRELQERCGSISSSVMSDRLRELGEAGVVAHTGSGYSLTPSGLDLLARLMPLDEWATHWKPAVNGDSAS
jgi:DNA-binding HxlR family transcriptional regulator